MKKMLSDIIFVIVVLYIVKYGIFRATYKAFYGD